MNKYNFQQITYVKNLRKDFYIRNKKNKSTYQHFYKYLTIRVVLSYLQTFRVVSKQLSD